MNFKLFMEFIKTTQYISKFKQYINFKDFKGMQATLILDVCFNEMYIIMEPLP